MKLIFLQEWFYLNEIFEPLKTDMCDKISQCNKCIEVDCVSYVPVTNAHAVINGDDYEKDNSKS